MRQADARERASVDALAEVANDLAGEFRLEPLLERILRSAVELLGCSSGSLCLIDTKHYAEVFDSAGKA